MALKIRNLLTKLRPYLMIGPAMTGIFLFTIYPIIRLVSLSFMNTNMLDPSKSRFVGLDNYRKVFARPDFYKALNNTLIYTVAVVASITILALLLAVWLNAGQSRLNRLVQAAVFCPHVVSIVSIALIWLWMMEPNFGLFNYLLRSLGFKPLQWLSGSSTAMACVVFISVWKAVGYDTLIYLAALQGVPQSLYEAAALDNAGKAKVFFRITLPMISPQLFFTLIIRTIASFKVFDTVRILTQGGPNNATTTLVYSIYTEALMNLRIGYSSVLGVVLLVFISLLTVVYFRGFSGKVHYQ
nr:sugar ABC transporter permease [uncultured Eisenbergiella sp.]